MVVHSRLEVLRGTATDRLRALPSESEERDVVVEGKKQTIVTWHDEPIPGHHRIVVAAYVPAMLGLASRVTAMGFMLDPDGRIRDLTDEELSRFQ